jgi:transposase-like protein
MIWLLVIGLLSGPATYGVMKVQELRKWRAAYDQGLEAGRGAAAASTVAAATETATAEREAEEATPLPADRSAVNELCKKRASCRERGLMK